MCFCNIFGKDVKMLILVLIKINVNVLKERVREKKEEKLFFVCSYIIVIIRILLKVRR